MSTSLYNNKNERTAFKYADNQYKIDSSYEEVYIFYQIYIENYELFKNNFLINEINMINVTSGKYEVETNKFKKIYINLKFYMDLFLFLILSNLYLILDRKLGEPHN